MHTHTMNDLCIIYTIFMLNFYRLFSTLSAVVCMLIRSECTTSKALRRSEFFKNAQVDMSPPPRPVHTAAYTPPSHCGPALFLHVLSLGEI